jgi:hypothetical protein
MRSWHIVNSRRDGNERIFQLKLFADVRDHAIYNVVTGGEDDNSRLNSGADGAKILVNVESNIVLKI